MPPSSPTHLVLIPSYNAGRKVIDTVHEALRHWRPVWIVVDGSTDGTTGELQSLAQCEPDIAVLVLDQNSGKGAAVLQGLRKASVEGYTHALIMDADGQHPAEKIPAFMAESRANPDAQILGLPLFDASAPRIRVLGRKLSNWWANFETLWQGIGDSLFGFRVYPIGPLRDIMERQSWMRGFDFDPEATVRLCWRGIRPINMPAPVKYLLPEEGGISHFRYLRDNLLLTWMHLRLIAGFVPRFPVLAQRRLRRH